MFGIHSDLGQQPGLTFKSVHFPFSLRHLILPTQDVTKTHAAEATMVTLLLSSNQG